VIEVVPQQVDGRDVELKDEEVIRPTMKRMLERKVTETNESIVVYTIRQLIYLKRRASL
jgi:hypothetical protein